MKKSFLIFIAIAAIFIAGCNGNRSATAEYSVHVWGNCEKCKATIEKSCDLKGVSEAVWNVDSKLLKLKLDTSQISLNTVLEAVAKAGYDNEKFYADDYSYGALQACCQYERRPFDSK
ncbi:MAG TPA: heavy-metal-associated domain-containing protein [Bacteroidia bacterium]|jgi:copper chaperone CopZ|nr:heavy-metal-associated domain-containing protein [Bacteroidia bacterium]